MTWRGTVAPSAGGEVAPRRGKGEDDISYTTTKYIFSAN
jgi:hypothetical protein